ncbi:MAG: hypothetical protein PSX36_08370 [bacterium]|nr:hypothetical protein [bacterium]
MFKPWHSFAFGILLFLLLGLLSFVFPVNGIFLSQYLELRFPAAGDLFSETPVKKDISKIIAAANEGEELTPAELMVSSESATAGISATRDKPKKSLAIVPKRKSLQPITSIQQRNQSALRKFFKALVDLRNQSSPAVHVLHYGDSQIEGDRITDFLRQKLQSQFGGEGPGLLSLMPLSPSRINKISTAPGWERYTAFAGKDKRVSHSNYGVLAGFNRFSASKKITDTSSTLTTSLSVTTTRFGGPAVMSYKKFKLFYGGAKRRTWCEFYDGPALMAADSLSAGGVFAVKEFNVGNGSFTHSIKFRGKDSPDFYAISLESDHGIMLDNIALRGSSGTFFHLINQVQLKQFYDYLNVKLIILQFGGNALPAIETEEMALNYASYLRSQISILKKVAPNASIIFIGPSDMSIKSGMEYVTYPFLELLRDAIKKVVLESDCAFYDMYDSMGGYNSMPSWVDEKLAASDYTHFSPQGARKIASLFYTALMDEYANYLKTID